ncbi:unnamed protein product [Albugo candida]|uniref:Palmitoyltransferase n=1 Tax=Albugo candida TaxID=65357 RepID=A0A024G8Y3_9STRA|nr:unnamed protein product [Albugo candida]|eukprot:CCI42782.1 unnamed protein product [Albugo candida]
MGCCETQVPAQCRFVPVILVHTLIVWLYGAFILYSQPLLYKVADIQELAAFHTTFGLLAWALTQCLMSTDSFLRSPDASDHTLYNASRAVEVKYNGKRRYCRKCKAAKPDRTHHCSTCGCCILKMDHHCIYINKCIGFYNYKFFLQFIGWSAVTCLQHSYLNFRYISDQHLQQLLLMLYWRRIDFFSASYQIVVSSLTSTCLGIALTLFWMVHVYFISVNMTTVEYCEKRRDGDYINHYDVGIQQNFKQPRNSICLHSYKMVQVTPVVRHKIVKKKVTKFKRHQSDNFIRVPTSWRRPKGIDGRVRRKFKGAIRMPNIGYGSNKKTRHVLPNGFKKFLVKNIAELEVLLMHNRKYCAEIAHNVSGRKRTAIIQRAEQLNIRVTNPNARVRAEENE